jgi:hypothetical protein
MFKEMNLVLMRSLHISKLLKEVNLERDIVYIGTDYWVG